MMKEEKGASNVNSMKRSAIGRRTSFSKGSRRDMRASGKKSFPGGRRHDRLHSTGGVRCGGWHRLERPLRTLIRRPPRGRGRKPLSRPARSPRQGPGQPAGGPVRPSWGAGALSPACRLAANVAPCRRTLASSTKYPDGPWRCGPQRAVAKRSSRWLRTAWSLSRAASVTALKADRSLPAPSAWLAM